MLIEYLLDKQKTTRKKLNLVEDKQDPSTILRQNGIKIKRIIPNEKYIEIFLFDDVAKIDLSFFKKFIYKKDEEENKLLVSYRLRG